MKAYSDCITLTGLRAYAYHGVYEFERREGQEFILDVTVWFDAQRAAESDEVGDTIDYAVLAQALVRTVESNPSDLIEHVALRVVATVFEHPLSSAVKVKLHKPNADLGVEYDDVAIELYREKHERM